MGNIKYNSNGFCEYYSIHRHKWEEFYDSERRIITSTLNSFDKPMSILDVGCACGGLGVALCENFNLKSYTGIDINEQNILVAEQETSKEIKCNCEFAVEDIAAPTNFQKYDVVISLSCVDFNNEVDKMIRQCWDRVAMGGYFIMSARITDMEGICDVSKSYQWINFKKEESATYVVFNYKDLIERLASLNDAEMINCYGYWGKPASSAITPYEQLCFSAVAVRKGIGEKRLLLDLPLNLFAAI